MRLQDDDGDDLICLFETLRKDERKETTSHSECSQLGQAEPKIKQEMAINSIEDDFACCDDELMMAHHRDSKSSSCARSFALPELQIATTTACSSIIATTGALTRRSSAAFRRNHHHHHWPQMVISFLVSLVA